MVLPCRARAGHALWRHGKIVHDTACILTEFYICPISIHPDVDDLVDNPIDSLVTLASPRVVVYAKDLAVSLVCRANNARHLAVLVPRNRILAKLGLGQPRNGRVYYRC